MTVTVPASEWQPRARRLADELDADGDLRTQAWRDTLLAVPRHEFVPRYYVQDGEARPLRWTTHEPIDTESTQRWLDLVYSPTTLITDLAEYADRGVQAPVSSSTKPDLMIRMLEALDVTEGMRVLEVGTGTGYNAALLAHRLGSAQVCSVDINPNLIYQARQRLSRLGYNPTLVTADGADGLPDHAPFDGLSPPAPCSPSPPHGSNNSDPAGWLWYTSKDRWVRGTSSRCDVVKLRYWRDGSCPGGSAS